ncbi:HipA-like protein [Brasilonema sp. UFV-L1]|uniref:HipA-like protein n=1 Tax=Brasilonema sp. UFV-L1 TaxID=2234130 RepID=UPI00145EB38E|nr:HipA-like protein [Brasilonema sp. UFV-L1]NMG11245.1 HipA-like protein [Brasilonema sp. UFV-L1]
MAEKFPIIEVPLDAPESSEEMGTKFKFWFQHPEQGYCLYKQARLNTGEDWAEKIAASLCELLGLPHAHVELATWNSNCGTVSPSFLPNGGSLILGNEILAPIIPDYPKAESFKVSQHTTENIFTALTQTSVNLPVNWTPPNGITTSAETFVGYLLLDAWIGNTDRHHENWAFISLGSKTYLAPTYDHASSMGRELLDDKRLSLLNNKTVTGYAQKCASAIYASVEDTKPLKTFDAFREAQQRYPNASSVWLDNLAKVSSNDTLELFQRIPSEWISQTAIEFAQKILEFNQNKLLKLRDTLP